MLDRRSFLLASAAAVAAARGTAQDPVREAAAPEVPVTEPLFLLSLAQWSLHKELFGRTEPRLDSLAFPRAARQLGFDAIELVNQFFKDKAEDVEYLGELAKVCDGEGVRCLLIMCDGEGRLGDPKEARRRQAVENHQRWVDAARTLGCHSIRVNAESAGTPEEQQARVADGLRALTLYAAERELDVLVENHGGQSSDAAWLIGVIEQVDHPRCGTLPDFGNFQLGRGREYDRYQGVAELMPYAKAVSAKSHDFDEEGDEVNTDYLRMMKIVVAAGYRGHVGIEYEGKKLAERDGILATKRLLERVRAELA